MDHELTDVDPNQPCKATALTGTSSITLLRWGQPSSYFEPTQLLSISTPLTIPLGIGTLYLNQTVVTGQVVTQRAAFLDLPGTANDVAVAVAESSSGLICR